MSSQPVYEGPLGLHWRPQGFAFYLWAPGADEVLFRVYAAPDSPKAQSAWPLQPGPQGIWHLERSEDLRGLYYTLETRYHGQWRGEAVEPYARAVAPQGQRAFAIDLRDTDPEGWAADQGPRLKAPQDAVLYELHVRDLSAGPRPAFRHKGRFLGLTEEGLKTPGGRPAGLDHIAELGVTHVHLLPIFDFDDLDDLAYNPEHYNWGYNPRNYNAPKNAYSSRPEDPAQGVKDLKRLVQTLHRRGLGVVMDMVYNHTFATLDSHLNTLVPDLYYRKYEGHFSNGSGCGNELASEHPMVRRMIVDSVLYWRHEYHIDGFRFDLMGLTDTDTINEITRRLRAEDPGMPLYGEGWTGGLSPLPEAKRALKNNAAATPAMAYFSDDLRDAIKGHVFESHIRGFVNGADGLEASVQFGVAGCTAHPQIDYERLLYSRAPWALHPGQTVNYAAAHDNHTLWDKLKATNPGEKDETLKALHRLANAIVFTSQGLSFLHAGEEFLRTKFGEENSYKSPDRINAMDWQAADREADTVDYYRGLIAFRRAHPAFRLGSTEEVQKHLRFLTLHEPRMVAFVLGDHAGGDEAGRILVAYNAHHRPRELRVPAGDWTIYINHERAGLEPLGKPRNHLVHLPPHSALAAVARA